MNFLWNKGRTSYLKLQLSLGTEWEGTGGKKGLSPHWSCTTSPCHHPTHLSQCSFGRLEGENLQNQNVSLLWFFSVLSVMWIEAGKQKGGRTCMLTESGYFQYLSVTLATHLIFSIPHKSLWSDTRLKLIPAWKCKNDRKQFDAAALSITMTVPMANYTLYNVHACSFTFILFFSMPELSCSWFGMDQGFFIYRKWGWTWSIAADVFYISVVKLHWQGCTWLCLDQGPGLSPGLHSTPAPWLVGCVTKTENTAALSQPLDLHFPSGEMEV